MSCWWWPEQPWAVIHGILHNQNPQDYLHSPPEHGTIGQGGGWYKSFFPLLQSHADSSEFPYQPLMARNENLDKVVYSTQVLAWCEKPHWETRCSRAGHHRRLLGSKKIIFPPFLWPCLACCYFLRASRCFPPSAGAQPRSSPPAASVFKAVFESTQHKSDKSSSACGETLGWGWWRQFRHVLGDPLGQAYRGWCWGKFISCRSGNHLDFAVGMDNEVSLCLRGAVSTGWKLFGLSPNSSFPWEIQAQQDRFCGWLCSFWGLFEEVDFFQFIKFQAQKPSMKCSLILIKYWLY